MMEQKHNFKKKYGQNFLQDNSLVEKIVSIVELNKDDLVIEIGPGAGIMTKMLVQMAQVLAYEIDKELKPFLDKIERNYSFDIIWDDFLNRNVKSDISDYKYNRLFVIANLPYYITTPIIQKIIDEKLDVESIVIMVQKEVADRYCSLPGCREYGSITVFLNYYFDVKKVFDVDRKNFFPIPNVDSSIICLSKRKNKIFVRDETVFLNLIRDSFQYKRKNLKNNLINYDLEKIQHVLFKYDLDLSVRAESLSIDIFADIANNL